MKRGFTADSFYKTAFVLARWVWISYLPWKKIPNLFSPCSENHTVVTFSRKKTVTHSKKKMPWKKNIWKINLRLSWLIMGLIWSNQTCGKKDEKNNNTLLSSQLCKKKLLFHFHLSPHSPSSFDGSETPSQSSPPQWGSCGSTPGRTAPCPRLFAVNRRGEKNNKRTRVKITLLWVLFSAIRSEWHFTVLLKNEGTSKLQETLMIRLWDKRAVTNKRLSAL